ncbi:MAG: sensor domain-containing diguanylate cyclase [Acidobacteria bacterium]|nr:sensor domain-containing diguanylate cyclase [Acidobacteriota bacterium]
MSGVDGRRTAPVVSAEEERDRLIAVLQAQGELQDLYIRNGADRAWWDAALRRVIALSGSQFGFLGRIEHEEDGTPFLHSLAITDIAWNEWSRQVFDDFASDGLEFRNLDSLFGVTVATGDLVVSDDPATDPRRCGLPPGHPPLDSYVGIPLRDGEAVNGMVGLANRAGGFEARIEDDLRPVLSVIAAMVARDLAERRAAEATAVVEQLGSAIEHLTRAEQERVVVDAAVRAILAAGSLREAEDVAVAKVRRLVPTMNACVMAEGADGPGSLLCVSGNGTELARADCVALQSGRLHVSLPGLRLDSCPHVDALDAVTVCCPVATDRDEFGLLVCSMRDVDGEDAAVRGADIAEGLGRMATALAQVALREDIASRALRDPLTGLPNRTALLQSMERRLRRIDAAARPFGVMIVDLDDFKDVNDQLGHAMGDEVIASAAAAIAGTVRADDVVARLGGDEFVVILDAGDPEVMRSAGQRMIDAISAVAPAGGPGISASAGGVPVGWGDPGWDEAYQRADVLLYEAKAAGKSQVVIGSLIGAAEQE